MNTFTAIPWGILPALEYDGKKLVQSISIARFVAREFGLAGKNNLEAAQADMLVDCMSDFVNSEYFSSKPINPISSDSHGMKCIFRIYTDHV